MVTPQKTFVDTIKKTIATPEQLQAMNLICGKEPQGRWGNPPRPRDEWFPAVSDGVKKDRKDTRGKR